MVPFDGFLRGHSTAASEKLLFCLALLHSISWPVVIGRLLEVLSIYMEEEDGGWRDDALPR